MDTATTCALLGHPLVTHNPWQDRTWCACGAVVRDGNHAVHGIRCCGGPLDGRGPR